MKNASKPTNTTVRSITTADLLWMKFESTSGAVRQTPETNGTLAGLLLPKSRRLRRVICHAQVQCEGLLSAWYPLNVLLGKL